MTNSTDNPWDASACMQSLKVCRLIGTRSGAASPIHAGRRLRMSYGAILLFAYPKNRPFDTACGPTQDAVFRILSRPTGRIEGCAPSPIRLGSYSLLRSGARRDRVLQRP